MNRLPSVALIIAWVISATNSSASNINITNNSEDTIYCRAVFTHYFNTAVVSSGSSASFTPNFDHMYACYTQPEGPGRGIALNQVWAAKDVSDPKIIHIYTHDLKNISSIKASVTCSSGTTSLSKSPFKTICDDTKPIVITYN